ncbi:hypothetical protein ACFLZV_01095 [Candidatus Margulisiibacteriota bacterium]
MELKHFNTFKKKHPKKDSFLYAIPEPPGSSFLPHLEYFLSNISKWSDSNSIIDRILETAPLTMESDKAWAKWRSFRSAQAEITVIYIIENYFKSEELEIIPTTNKKTPDFKVFIDYKELLIEVKAQSGQQHGNKHPLDKGNNHTFFQPQFANDLKSFLFEKKHSSRDDKPMIPKTLEAEQKNADILVAMTDYFRDPEKSLAERMDSLCPGCKFAKQLDLNLDASSRLTIHFFQGEFPVDFELKKLKEIWLFDESALDEFIVLYKNTSCILEHLNK